MQSVHIKQETGAGWFISYIANIKDTMTIFDYFMSVNGILPSLSDADII